MREYGSNINLPSLDNLFSSEQERQDAKLEKIQILPLTELHPFRNHPFQVRDDDEMDKMVDSIKEYGVMTPAIVRPRKDGGYEIVAGHRRCHASQRAGVETMPCIVRDKQASRMLGLPPYYLRRLCKEVPGVAFQSGIKWYINLGKLVDYYNNSGRNAAG